MCKEDGSIIHRLNLANVTKLELICRFRQECMVQTVIDKFQKLRHFNAWIEYGDENVIYKPLKNISNLKHLIHFCYAIHFGELNNKFCGLLKQMANYCQNLKSIDCRFKVNEKNMDIRQYLSQLKAFPALKRLQFWLIIGDNEGEDNIDVNQLFSFELFKGLENITHLSLGFSPTQVSKESILKEIDINLPKLQYLKLTDRFEHNCRRSDTNGRYSEPTLKTTNN